jgi:hypothetical protein
MSKHYGKRDPISHRTPEQVHEMDNGYNAQPEHVKTRICCGTQPGPC